MSASIANCLKTNQKARGYAICFFAVGVLSTDSFFIRHVTSIPFWTWLFYRHLFAAASFFLILLVTSYQTPVHRPADLRAEQPLDHLVDQPTDPPVDPAVEASVDTPADPPDDQSTTYHIPAFMVRILSVRGKAILAIIHVVVYSLAFSVALRYGIVAISLVIISRLHYSQRLSVILQLVRF
jgi:hypothetical protein